MPRTATADRVDRDAPSEFLRPRHRAILTTRRASGGLHSSPVACGVDAEAEVLDLPEAVEPLVEYFRCISGEHPDWDEYRAAMQRQGKCLVRIRVTGSGPIATGGFPPELVDKD